MQELSWKLEKLERYYDEAKKQLQEDIKDKDFIHAAKVVAELSSLNSQIDLIKDMQRYL